MEFGETPLKTSNTYPYLGVVLATNGIFYQAQKTLAEQASKAIYSLNSKLSGYVNLSPKFMLDLFDKCILPILMYGCEVWGFHDAPNIERVQLKFCKIILKVRKCTPNNFIYGELGRYPLKVSRYTRIVKYWLNIVTGEKSAYICSVYNDALSNIDRINQPSWIKSVRDLLRSSGFADVWLNQGVGDKTIFIKVFKARCIDIFKQNWHGEIRDSSKSIFYRSIRTHPFYVPYLDVISAKSHRIAFTRLILSGHKLHIESGRWTNPVSPRDREEKYFPYCPRKLEDEYHFLAECTFYNDLRKQFIPRYYWKKPSMLKIVE